MVGLMGAVAEEDTGMSLWVCLGRAAERTLKEKESGT